MAKAFWLLRDYYLTTCFLLPLNSAVQNEMAVRGGSYKRRQALGTEQKHIVIIGGNLDAQ